MNSDLATTMRTGNTGRFALFLIGIYYLPTVLIWRGYLPFEHRFAVLVILTLVVAAYSLYSGLTLRDLGFRRDTLARSLIVNGLLSVMIVLALYVLFKAGLLREPTLPIWSLFYPFYVLVSGPAQEFLFRSVLFAEMARNGVRSPLLRVFISAVTYSFLHVIYNDSITLIVTLAMGITWGYIYERLPNFWGVTLSHVVLGIVSMLLGLI